MSLFLSPSTHDEYECRPRRYFFKNTIYEKFSLKKDLILKGISYTLQPVHCEKVASAINKKLV
jgi:hypothetical protein